MSLRLSLRKIIKYAVIMYISMMGIYYMFIYKPQPKKGKILTGYNNHILMGRDINEEKHNITNAYHRDNRGLHWVQASGKVNLKSRLEYYGEFLGTVRRQMKNVNLESSAYSLDDMQKFKIIYEGKDGFFNTIANMKNVDIYMMPWVTSIDKWDKMREEAKGNHIKSFLPVKEYYPTALTQTLLWNFKMNSSVAQKIVPVSSPLESVLDSSGEYIETFMFDYHGMHPHKDRHWPKIVEMGAWDIRIECKNNYCMGYPDMMSYLLVLKAQKYRINLDSNGRLYIPDVKSTLVMSTCYIDNVIGTTKFTKNVYADEVIDLTQKMVAAIYHGLAESLTKLTVFVPFLKLNPKIKIHFTPNGYTKRLLPIVLEMYNLKNSVIMHKYIKVEANTVYVPPGMGCFRGGDVIGLQLTSQNFHKWIENKFKGNTTRNLVVLLKRAKRSMKNFDEIRDIVLDHVKKTNGKAELYIFDDTKLPPVEIGLQLFYRALVVIGTNGAGLTNIIFSRPGTYFIEMLCRYMNPTFKEMTYKLGMHYFPSLSVAKDDNLCHTNGPLVDAMEIRQLCDIIFEDLKTKNYVM